MREGLTSIIIPTAYRANQAEACIDRLLCSVHNAPIEVICVVDEDIETLNRLMAIAEHDIRVRVLWKGRLDGSPKAWNRGLRASYGEYIVMGADDLVFHDGWLPSALSTLANLPEGIGLVGLHDGHQWVDPGNPTMAWCTHWLAHRRFIVEYMGGVMAFECYPYGYNDTEAWFRATRAGRYSYCQEALVYHRHYDYGDRPQDDLDKRNRSWLQESERVFRMRQSKEFPDDFVPVITR